MTNDHDDFDGPTSPEEESPAQEQMARHETRTPAELFDGIRAEGGAEIEPVKLAANDSFKFSCHKGISCWNACCRGADVTLTPFDILRLCRRLDTNPNKFLQQYTVPDIWEKAGLPVAKLAMGGDDGRGACPFLDEETGCTVYEDRPATCRYYPLGLAAIKMKDGKDKDQFHFLVKETHCKGHEEAKNQTVSFFRQEQGVEEYDNLNQGWIDIMMKMVSWRSIGGPQGRDISAQTKKMFFMVSTNVEMFRHFVFESKFLDTYEIAPEALEELKTNDEALLLLGFDWMKNVMFNEPTISMKQDVLRAGIAKTRSELGAG
ncbi:MAG: YkgJ family cysteine cluster protein [Rhodospirillales bacterium]|nr:YkgJ family cysteine cluster protein [Rhodospirillales bacterium]